MYLIALSQLILIATVLSQTPVTNITAKYDAADLLRKIFNTNDTILPRANYGLIQFEGQTFEPGFVNFETESNQEVNINNIVSHGTVKFENEYEPTYNNNIQYENTTKDGLKKKRRRKRKPKQHYYGLQDPGSRYNPEFGGPLPYPMYPGQYYRPSRPRPSLASEALSTVTGALTSIAMYDDYQCVPRLLCEAAAGGALGNSGILQTVSGLQPLLTLLSAYTGASSNPLFVFGRAALLGASSDSSPSTCRYAYPLCPTDTEQLVHYLNNHNGGFFRFFNAPQQGQQNVEQFYNQLSQNYGPYNPNQDHNQNGHQDNYGLYNNPQDYGYYRPGLYSNYDQNYGIGYPHQNYNQNIRFKNNDNFSDKTIKIEKRIQNAPNTYSDDLEDENPKWTFPEGNLNYADKYLNNHAFTSDDNKYDGKRTNENYLYEKNRVNDNRKGKALKFPGDNNGGDYLHSNSDNIQGSFFPDQSNKQYQEYNTVTHNNYDDKYDKQYLNSDYNKYHAIRQNYDYNSQQNYYDYDKYNNVIANLYYADTNKYYNHNYINNNKYNNYNSDLQNGVQTVYVVRGNGDPNNPEVYKLRPGQTIQ